jgi:threonine/homoserine/homoserine lactone efflux protein
MGDAIGQILPLAVGVALSPLPIVAVVLMLVTRQARVNGPAFVVGWLVGLGLVGVLVLVVVGPTDASDNSGAPATWVSVLKLVLGALLVLVAIRQWTRRPASDEEVPTPKWMGAIEGFTPAKSAGAGVVLSAANPKNLLLAVAAGAAVANTGIAGGEQAVAYGVFALIGTVGVAAPVVIFFSMGEKAGAILDRLKGWMIHNNSVVMAVLCLVIGAKLVGEAISGFAA